MGGNKMTEVYAGCLMRRAGIGTMNNNLTQTQCEEQGGVPINKNVDKNTGNNPAPTTSTNQKAVSDAFDFGSW